MAVMMNKVWKQYIAEYCRIKFIACYHPAVVHSVSSGINGV